MPPHYRDSSIKVIGEKVYYMGEHVATLNEKAIRGSLDGFKRELERKNES